MESETIVAVYDTAAHADAAIADLRFAQVPESSISRHTGTTGTATMAAPPVREQGFWASLFGGDTDHDATVYDRSLDTGSSVVVVKSISDHDIDSIMAILEKHSPIDIDERVSAFGLTSTAATDDPVGAAGTTGMASTVGISRSMAPPSTNMMPTSTTALSGQAGMRTTDEGGIIQLSEESLAVGKRLINRGGTRIRRYVVETPVEESVTRRPFLP